MPDELDIAEQQAAALLQHAIMKASSQKPEAEATGKCLNCGERIRRKGVRWCDDSCRDDWSKRQRRST